MEGKIGQIMAQKPFYNSSLIMLLEVTSWHKEWWWKQFPTTLTSQLSHTCLYPRMQTTFRI